MLVWQLGKANLVKELVDASVFGSHEYATIQGASQRLDVGPVGWHSE